MADSGPSRQMSEAVLAFAFDGRFPENVTDLPNVTDTDLQPTIDALEEAKHTLENEIHTINNETKDDVSSWVQTAKTLQEDIIRSKSMANEIIRQSEAPDVSGEAIQNAEEKADFLNQEMQYSQQLHGVLKSLRHASKLLDEVEQARDERRILDSLHLLEQSWTALDGVGIGKSCRIVRLLDVRAFELKSAVHETFNQIWASLVQVDVQAGRVELHDKTAGNNMTLVDAEIGLRAYKEVDERMEQFWRNINTAIISPRMKFNGPNLPGIVSTANSIELIGSASRSVEALLADLSQVFGFLARKLPTALLNIVNGYIMTDVIPVLVHEWLDSEVPSSLNNMDSFQSLIEATRSFCQSLEDQGYSGFDDLSKWVETAPTIWLSKCRDTALNIVRNKLIKGIGGSRQVEKVEKQIVSVDEGRELTTSGAGAGTDTNDWGDDWGNEWHEEDGEEAPADGGKEATKARPADDDDANDDSDDAAKAWGWGEDEKAEPEETKNSLESIEQDGGSDDGADAWGWSEENKNEAEGETGDVEKPPIEDDGAEAWGWDDGDKTNIPSPVSPKKSAKRAKHTKSSKAPDTSNVVKTRELILRETYSISSMPEPVLELIFAILEDGAILTKGDDEYNLVASTAAGLLTMPTLALALFRAISPYYYSLHDGGSMFLYNDALYLAEQLSSFSAKWKAREDLTTRAKNIRLDNDIKTLQNFANRSYAAEMSTQRTVLHDMLGSTQSIMQQDDLEGAVEAGVERIRAMASTWEPILARSVWSQAVGSLIDSLATRIIGDVMDMSSIGQEESYSIASVIASATELDSLFLPSQLAGTEPVEDEIAVTTHYAPNWLRLKYLSEVLQSNLNDVRFLWCERELSLYFSMDEIIDLVHASFEDSPKRKDTLREIRANPPRNEPL